MRQSIRSAFRRIMLDRQWAVSGTMLLVGVSGGVDSMTLLHLLCDLSRELGMKLVAAHLNHELRGEESERDARFVGDMAGKWGIPIEMGREDAGAVARREKIPVQVAARKVRYSFFEKAMAKYGADWLVLGHNADDVAETVMMRWLRGSSVEGLRGIPEQNGRVIRPLLSFTRSEIMEYARAYKISFVEDSSNQKLAYFRNRIRHELFPLLEDRYQPKLTRRLTKYAKYFSELHSYLSGICEELSGRVINEKGEILLKRFTPLPITLKRLILETYLLKGACIPEPLTFEELDEIVRLTERTEGTRRITLGKGLWMVREYDRLFVMDTPFPKPIEPVMCPVPGTVEVGEIGNRLTVKEVVGLPEAPINRQEAYVDGDNIGMALWLRSFRPGDRIVTRRGTVKVKKLFIDRKIPLRFRPRIPIVGAGDEIVWVGGLCVSHLFYVRENTRRILHLRFSRPVETE